MKKFTTLRAQAVPLQKNDVDTDLIIPAQFLTSTSMEGYGKNLFRRLRDTDPNFPLNQERFRNGKILISGENFGCGSSREHAVWALLDGGFDVVIAKSFADIFSANSGNNGLLLIVLDPTVVDTFLRSAEAGNLMLTVDLENSEVRDENGGRYSFPYDPFRKYCLLNGLDPLDYLQSFQEDIKKFQTEKSSSLYYRTTDESAP